MNENLSFRLINDETAYEIFKCSLQAAGEVVIPDEYEGLPVLAVGDKAFYGCGGLTGALIGGRVKRIGSWAFSDCSELKNINIPDGVESVEDYAFYGCGGLVSIAIGKELKSLGEHVFEGCRELTLLKVSAENVTYKSENDCLIRTKDKKLLLGADNGAIPASTSVIGHSAFMQRSALNKVLIPEGVTAIEDYAFYGCPKLISVSIPATVTGIGEGAFLNCEELKSITVAGGGKAFSGEGNCIVRNKDKALIAGCQSSVIPEYVKTIEKSAFFGCGKLSSINIPEGVTSIGSQAFRGCFGLSEITIPNSVMTIGEWVFLRSNLTINVRGKTQKPSGWHNEWNAGNRPVNWNYRGD